MIKARTTSTQTLGHCQESTEDSDFKATRMIRQEVVDEVTLGDNGDGDYNQESTNQFTYYPVDDIEDPEAENPANDLTGAVRNWKNWINPTFAVTGSNVPIPNYPITRAIQISPDLNTLKNDSMAFYQALEYAKSTGQLFEDSQFPATYESLLGYGEAKKDRTAAFSTYEWERPEKAIGHRVYTVGGDAVGPQDLKQGKLGNCYFIAALAAVSEFPERIKRIIRMREPSKQGVHCIALNVCGLWEDVIIDDRIPRNPEKKRPAFCRSAGHDIWVCLIEKAWAKVHGGYSNIEAGYINEALSGLTGAPVKIFRVKDNEDEAWQDLLEAKQRNYITCASSSAIDKVSCEVEDKKTGLYGGHAYSLLAAFEINNKGSKVRLVRMRNPWGRGEWKGDWSDKSDLWTPELKAQFGVTDKDDGIFHMTFSDAGKYFHDFAICHYRDNYVSSAKKFMTSPEHPTVITFTISNLGEYYIKLHQISKRIFKKADLYTYTPLTIVVARIEGNNLVYVGNASRARDQVWVHANCYPGNYVAFITTPWKRLCNHLTFSIYGPNIVDFQAQDPSYLPADFIQRMMLDCARNNKKDLKTMQDKGHPGMVYIKKRANHMDSLSYYYFFNGSNTHIFKVTATVKALRDCEIMAPHSTQEGGVIEKYLSPGEELIIIGRQTGAEPKLSIEVKHGFKEDKSRR